MLIFQYRRSFNACSRDGGTKNVTNLNGVKTAGSLIKKPATKSIIT